MKERWKHGSVSVPHHPAFQEWPLLPCPQGYKRAKGQKQPQPFFSCPLTGDQAPSNPDITTMTSCCLISLLEFFLSFRSMSTLRGVQLLLLESKAKQSLLWNISPSGKL